MKILILANNDMGLYKFRKELIAELLKENEVYMALPNGEYISKMKAMGVIFYPIYINRRGKNIVQEIKLFQHYMKLIGDLRPDVVLTYTVKPNIYGGIACELLRVPYIANITGLGTEIESGNMFSKALVALYKMALKRANVIFFQNKSNREFFARCGFKHGNMKLLPGSGVNLQEHCFEEYPEKSDELVFLFVGRLMRDKGVVELVEATKHLKKKYKNIKVQLVGYCEKDFKEEIEKRNVAQYVELCGQQDDVHSFMKKCHAVVLPSYHEGMANVLLEGAACGRPILASNVPGCRETFDEGKSGFGFEARSVHELEKTMEKFIHLDYQKKIEMGKAGRLKMEKEFNRNIIINKYKKALRNI